MYQWGRKDPFPGGKSGTAGFDNGAINSFSGLGSAGTVSGSTNAAAIVESIQKPTTFFKYKNTDYYDWLPANDSTLWSTDGKASGKKYIYDPCPSGWRVPARTAISTSDDDSPWKGVAGLSFTEGDTGGVSWDNNAKYPAAGYRYNNSGGIYYEGSVGRYWSASPYSSSSYYASYLYFYSSGNINRSNSNSRAMGISVRCVQE